MLVLSRKKDEKVLLRVPGLDDDIEITVVRIDTHRIRIGINAPKEVNVLRSELDSGVSSRSKKLTKTPKSVTTATT